MGKRTYAKRSSSSTTKKRKKTNYSYPSGSGKRAVSAVSGPGTRLKAKFTYCDRLTLTGVAAGATGTYVFRINSLFDPDFAFGGHQPAGYDELMAIYEHYAVTEVQYKVLFNSTSATAPMLVGVSVADNSNTNPDHRYYVENGATQMTTLSGLNGGGVKSLTGSVNIADLMGVPMSTLLKDDTFWGAAGSNPADQAYLKIWSTDTAIAAGDSVEFQVELNFSATLMGGRFLSLS